MFATMALMCGSAALPGARSDELKIRPHEDVVVERTYGQSLELDLDTYRLSSHGQPMPAGFSDGVTGTFSERRKLKLRDRQGKLSGGHAGTIRREFVEISGRSRYSLASPQGSPYSYDRERTSPLAGHVAEFTWSDSSDDYRAELPDLDDGEELATELSAGLDLAGFLPSGSVASGDKWYVGSGAVGELLRPGGDLAWSQEEGEENGQRVVDVLAAVEGSLQATYRGRRTDGDADVGVIAIEGDLSTQAHWSARAAEGYATDTRVEVRLHCKGTLTWDFAAGRWSKVELEGAVTATHTFDPEDTGDSEWHRVGSRSGYSGTLHLSATFESLP